MTKAAIYLRVSTEEQAEQNISLPFQRSRLMAYCESKGWEIYDIYMDDGYSGKDLNRPEVSRMINDAKSGAFNIVLVWKLDRLSRRQQHVMYLIEDVFQCQRDDGIGFASVTENFDTSTPMGRAMLGIMAVFGQLERETIIERVTEGRHEAAKQGRFLGGHAMYGFRHDREKKELEIDDIRVDTVRWIYDQYLSGKGFATIAQELTKRKLPSPSGNNFWRPLAVARILTNPGYAGYLEHKGKIHKARHPGIIDKETWDAVQDILKSRNHFRPQNKTKALLNGIIYCAECGARMRKKLLSRRGIDYYVCYSVEGSSKHMVKDPNCPGHYYQSGEIENKVIQQLMQISLDPIEIRRAALEDLNETEKPHDIAQQIKNASKDLEDVRRRIKRWHDAFETGSITTEEMRERTNELKERRMVLENELAALQEVQDNYTEAAITIEELITEMKHFKENWELANFDERRMLLTGMISKVMVDQNGEVKVKF